jgi:predicted  nucleic acid-binding Zn-ribbon protein
MGLRQMVRKFMKKVIPTVEETTRDKWQRKLDNAKVSYADELNRIKTREEYYFGKRTPSENPNTGKAVTKQSINVRNIVYEIVESQVDSAIPEPHVTAIHPEDQELARKLEHFLSNKKRSLNMELVNDPMERTVPTIGADFVLVEWDNKKGLHTTMGDVALKEIHPRQVIPQPGVTEFSRMDYFFIQIPMTKDQVKSKWGIDVSEEEEESPELRDKEDGVTTDIVTVNECYYRNNGKIGLFIWCGYTTLFDMSDYQARQLERCVKCGAVKTDTTCPVCGGKKFKREPVDYEEMADAVEIKKKYNIDLEEENEAPAEDENGNPIMDEEGNPETEIKHTQKKIPYYKPGDFPIVIRRSITVNGKFLGLSDVDVIRDQQDTITKLGDKITEKLMKAGSIVTLPEGKGIETTENELKVVRVANPNEKSLIDVLTLQPDATKDLSFLETNYSWAKSGTGITDSYQGKYDASADSGSAKQYAINQAASRLNSKRTMKNKSYAEIYKKIFQLWLSYSDDEVTVQSDNEDGTSAFDTMSRYEFLRMDKAGELYWDDEFIIDTDPTSTLLENHEAMWDQAKILLQSGAFGQLGDMETNRLYWKFMEKNNYPNAGSVLKEIEKRIQDQTEQAQEMDQQQEIPEGMQQTPEVQTNLAQQMGAQNVMSDMRG